MAIITKITVQKKNKERYNIYLDEEYAFSVDEAILITYHLRKGLEVTKELLEEVVVEDHLRKAYQATINYLSYRMRSIKEVRDYLIKKEFEVDVINKIVDRLKKENYLNDSEFAKAFVQSRLNLTLKGPDAIKRELMEKGISETEVSNSLQLFKEEDQLEKASLFLRKKYPSKLKTSRSEQDRKMYTLLLSRGFTHDIVQKAFKAFHDEAEVDNDEEWEAINHQGEKAFKKYRSESDWETKQKVKQYLYRKGFSFDLIERFIEYYEEQGE
jgi:regulatory protein